MEAKEKETSSSESQIRKLITDLLENIRKKNNEKKKLDLEEYAKRLTVALEEFERTSAVYISDTHILSLGTKDQEEVTELSLDDAVKNLQNLVLQDRPISSGPESSNVELLKEYVKELIEEIDDVVNVDSNQEINDICRRIKTEANRIIISGEEDNKAAIATDEDSIRYEVDEFERATNEHVKNLICKVEDLPDSEDKILFNKHLDSLTNKRNILRFATLSTMSNRRVTILNQNLQEILSLEDKIQMILNARESPQSYTHEPVPWLVQSSLIKSMFNVATERDLGLSFLMYVDEQRMRTDLKNPAANLRLNNHLRKLTHTLKALIVRTRVAVHNFDLSFEDGYNTVMEMFEEINKRCDFGLHSNAANQRRYCFDLLKTAPYLSTHWNMNVKDIDECASHVITNFEQCVHNMNKSKRKSPYELNTYDIQTLIATARTKKKVDDVVYNASIEGAVKEVIIQMSRVQEALELVNQVFVQQKSLLKASEPKIPVERPSISQRISRAVSVTGALPGRSSDPLLPSKALTPSQIRSRFRIMEAAGMYSDPVHPGNSGTGAGSDAEASGGSSSISSAPTRDVTDGSTSSSSPYLVSLPPDPARGPAYQKQFLDAFQYLNEAINDLCRIASRRRLQQDCKELLRNLQLQEALLKVALPSCGLSYAQCVRALEKHNAEVIPLLNSDQPMPPPAFWRSLRFVTSTVCQDSDLAIQCAYFISVSHLDPTVAENGLVDVHSLRTLLQEAQTTCYRMQVLETPQAEKEMPRLLRQIQQVKGALVEAGGKLPLLQEELEAAAMKIHNCAMTLHTSFEQQQWAKIPADNALLLSRLRSAGQLMEHPGLQPPAPGSERDRGSSSVLNSATSQVHETISLLEEVSNREAGLDETPVRWIHFDFERRAVIVAFKGTLNKVKIKGRNAGLVIE